jgi:LuxR family glucitol operon transcriptional activator
LAGDVIVQMREASLDFDSLVDTLARQLGRWELPTLRAEEKRTALAQILRQQRYLILIDNLETTENAYALVAQVSRLLNPSRALVTSRQQVRHNFVRSFSLQGLDEVDSLFFLRTDAQQRGIPHLAEMPTEQLVPIHEMTGGAPLALKLVIAQAQFLDLSLILQQFRQAGGNLYPFIFRQSWLHLSPTAQRLLIYIGRTVVTTVGWEELNSVGIAANETLLLAAIDQLIAYSLLTVSAGAGQKRYGIHQLTRQFVTSDLPEIWRAQG